jgi:hypothetical protein
MVTQEYTCAYAAVSVADGKIDTLILPYVNTVCSNHLTNPYGKLFSNVVVSGNR